MKLTPLSLIMSTGCRLGCVLVAVVLFSCCFRAHAQTVTESVVHSFTGKTDGTTPAAGLIQAGDGNLYGTTRGDDSSNFGGIYKLTTAGTFTNLYTFTGIADGSDPIATLYQGIDGDLYGTTAGSYSSPSEASGSVFSITPAGMLSTLYNFTGNSDGANSTSSLIQLGEGTFYGTTQGYGDFSDSGYGNLFHIGPATPFTTIFSFNQFNGARPEKSPVEGLDGNFYGVTAEGGTNGLGTVYQLTPSGTLTTLYNFTGTGDGANPPGPLIEGPDGNFYGTTNNQDGGVTGPDQNGTIFRVTPAGVLTTLYTLNETTDGIFPSGDLFLGGDGFLYGTIFEGGANGLGTMFRISLSGSFSLLYSFGSPNDAGLPAGAMLEDSNGTFWGVGAYGGANSKGAVYKMTLSPTPPAPVTLTSSASAIALGDSLTLSWSATNAFSNTMRRCNAGIDPAPRATGGWSGTQAGTFNAATGLWSGSATFTPVYPGIYTYGITCGGVESGTVAVTVGNPAALTIVTTSLPAAYTGVPYSTPVNVRGGVPPYTFAVTVGSLPAGLALDPSTGIISGTPTTVGASNFTVKVTDSDAVGAATTSASFAMTVLQPIKLTTTALPNGRVGTAYSQQLAATGGTPPYTFSLAPGSSLPAGLALSSSGLISGVPTAATTSSFTVSITDSVSTKISATLSLTIDAMITTSGVLTLTPSTIQVGGTTVASLAITAPASSPAMTGTVQFTANGQPLGLPVTRFLRLSQGAPAFTSCPLSGERISVA